MMQILGFWRADLPPLRPEKEQKTAPIAGTNPNFRGAKRSQPGHLPCRDWVTPGV